MTKRKKPGEYRIRGTDQIAPEEKVTAKEKARRTANRELRTPRCIQCGRAREKRSYPICARCAGGGLPG